MAADHPVPLDPEPQPCYVEGVGSVRTGAGADLSGELTCDWRDGDVW